VNSGTAKNPIAAAVVELQYTVSTPLTKDTNNVGFSITGTGDYKPVN
jgi:hypothetical protein